MLKSIAIGTVTEPDIDGLVVRAGGRLNNVRVGSNEPTHADYIFDDAVVELKFVVEEGLSKETRRAKLANLFSFEGEARPVVVLDPGKLTEDGQRHYYNILLGPIQKHVRKAADQIDHTISEIGGAPARILFILNLGYTAVDHSEFKRLVQKSARNDTRGIDAVIVGGIYHYGDGFNSFVFFPLEICQINVDRVFRGFDKLKREWDKFSEEMMTQG